MRTRTSTTTATLSRPLVLHVRTRWLAALRDERAAAPVALAGGLLAPGAPLRKRVEHRLKSPVLGLQVRAVEVVPVRGAVRGAPRFRGVSAVQTCDT